MYFTIFASSALHYTSDNEMNSTGLNHESNMIRVTLKIFDQKYRTTLEWSNYFIGCTMVAYGPSSFTHHVVTNDR